MTPDRIRILDVPVDCVSMDSALEYVEILLQQDGPSTVIAVNPEKVIAANHDARLKKRIETADLLIPDGIGVVFAAQIFGLAKIERVPGADLMPEICRLAEEKGLRVFLFGGTEEVNREAHKKLLHEFPDLQIAGNQHGYVQDEDMTSIVREINESRADILFLALGSPKQEAWMSEHLAMTNVRLCQGIGGTLDVLSGRVKRAPRVFRSLHLEWLYRLASTPQRIWRYRALPKFVASVARHKLFSEPDDRAR